MGTRPGAVRFADYELDLNTGALRRGEVLLKLQPQPAKVLVLLVRRAGEIVTRQELAQQVWGSETFVDFEQGLNFAIRQIRTALGDDAEHPKFVETLPKRGYRFVGEVTAAKPMGELGVPAVGSRGRRIFYKSVAIALPIILLISGLGWSRLHRKPTRGSGGQIRSLAVLPLRNLSNDPEQEYFSDGMTDELITRLAKIPGLRIISHTSVERYKGTKKDLPTIARELGVGAVVEGTVIRAGDRVRISAQLIEARTDQHLWADSYERDLKDILAMQDEVAQRIAAEVGINLTDAEQARFKRTHGVDPAAHEAYLKGEFYWNQLNCGGLEKALGYYQDAIRKDANFAPAYSAEADTYFRLADWRCWPLATFEKAKTAAAKAVELDPNFAEAHELLGDLAFSRDWDWAKADEEYSRSIQLDPNAAGTYSAYAIFLMSMGKSAQALATMRKAQQLDPISENTSMTYIYVLYLARQYDQAIGVAKDTLELYPNSGAVYYWLGQCYERKGMFAEAMTAYLKARAGDPKNAVALQGAYDKRGLAGYWEEDMQLRRMAKKEVDPVIEAMAHVHAGETEKALELLKAGYEQHCDGMQFLKAEPLFDDLREEAKFKVLMARMRL